MLGAIAGDIIGSVYEWNNIKHTDFPLFSPNCFFTDDTILTVAVADCILKRGDYAIKFKEYYRLYPDAGYGSRFRAWAQSPSVEPYNSWGNGSAMRVSPIGFAFDTLEDVLEQARLCAAATHNHPEGIKGAQATAAAVFLARRGNSKERIKAYLEDNFAYSLDQPLAEIRKHYTFNESCQETVPQAITAFLEAESFEDAVRKAVSIGGDSDTVACITGGVAEAFYGGVPRFIAERVMEILDPRLRRMVKHFSASLK